jgi:signal transduction histidine kinase
MAMPDLNSEVAAAFERHEREIGLQRLRLGCWIAIPLTIAGAIIDFFCLDFTATPGGLEFSDLFAVRLLFSAAIVPILWLAGRPWGARHFQFLGIALAMAPAACMAYIVYRVPAAGAYYAGLNLVLLGVALVMQWSLRQSLITAVLLVLMYVMAVSLPGSADVGNKWENWPVLATNFWFLLLTSVIAVIGSHVSYQLRIRDFHSRWNLDRSRQELEGKNKKLEELDEIKGRFFANISHELRTPLTLLLGPLEQLRANPRLVEDPRVREYLDTMNDNGLRLLKLINDLLDLVRLDAGRLRLNRVNVDVGSFTRGLLNSVRRFAEDRGLRVTCDIQGGLRQVAADPDKLEKVFLNLLFNSIKFTPAGGEVRLTGHQDGEQAVFRISDTGVGMSAENMARLFERFWQADTSAHRKHQGAGIGLALVKELVEAHGGTVAAQSELGRGTTMTVRLPIGPEVPAASVSAAPLPAAPSSPTAVPAARDSDRASDPSAAHRESGPGTPPERAPEDLSALYRRAELYASITPLRESLRPWNPTRGGTHPLVLVVDDEPDMLRFLRSQVEDDYEVREAVDGNQATVLAAQYLPDAVVCDMMLPEKDGMQVCRELRANHTTRSIPFLMLTARADDETKLAALAAGASDFLAKPFSSAELKLRLKNLVDARRLQKELSRQNKQLESTLEELRETETQLVQAEKMASLGRLSAGIIHEINNPLNFTRTGLHILTRLGRELPEALREEYEEVLRDMGEGITRVSTIVSDLRQFSHPENSVLDDVDADVTLEAALRFLSVEWKDGRVEDRERDSGRVTVRANKNKLVQVFIEHLPERLRCDARASAQGGEAAVAPEGVGGGWAAAAQPSGTTGPECPTHHLAHIFEPFYTTKEWAREWASG